MSKNKLPHGNHWYTRHFGSRRGLLITLWYKLLSMFGAYRRYKSIDWARVDRLVFVCKGNICRSAFAERVARSLGCDTISFGLDTIAGGPANPDAVSVAADSGFDLHSHKTITRQMVELKDNDLLIAMEPWQAEQLEVLYKDRYQTTLLGLWLKPTRPHLHDPYGLSLFYFHNCFKKIESAVRRLAEKCASQH